MGFGWQEWSVLTPELGPPGVNKIDPKLAPIESSLSWLGMPGLTAYFGLLDVGRPRPGETVVVSAASGAVGQLVGQIANLAGCRAVAIAGNEDKLQWCREMLEMSPTALRFLKAAFNAGAENPGLKAAIDGSVRESARRVGSGSATPVARRPSPVPGRPSPVAVTSASRIKRLASRLKSAPALVRL